jgi:prepilin-type N-terminal cleavage/methylation domain-containing protein
MLLDRNRRTTAANRAGGFSLIELMVVVAVIAILGGMIVPISAGMIARAKADGASVVALTWLEAARNRAVAERRNFEVTFDTATNRIKVERVEPDATKTPVIDYQLEDQLEYMRFAGADDTPDLFGQGSDVDFDGPTPHMFTSDGSFMDANGDPSNGTIFMGKPGQPETGRAITILGVNGVIRVWKLAGVKWYQ